MTTREDIVADARAMIGTPWVHQHREPGVGIDCVGMPTVIARRRGLSTFDLTDYERAPDGIEMLTILSREMRRIEVRAMQPGDLVVMKIVRLPQHVGILSRLRDGGLGIIHADSRRGEVVEHRLDERWRALIVAAFAFPGINE